MVQFNRTQVVDPDCMLIMQSETLFHSTPTPPLISETMVFAL
jgi:hypothetical protein